MSERNQTLHEVLEQFSEFPVPTYEEWKNVTEKSLKGASFETLLTKTYEGITLKPMYQKKDLENLPFQNSFPGIYPYKRGTVAVSNQTKPWIISQEITLPTPELVNEALRHDLENGQTGINLVLDEAALRSLDADEANPEQVGKNGVSIQCAGGLDTIFQDIDVMKYPVYIHAGAVSLPFLACFAAFLKEKQLPLQELKGCIGADPLAALAVDGELPYSLNESYALLAKVTKWAKENTPQLRTILVQSLPYHNGGGSAVEELAFTLAAAVEYVTNMLERGLAIDEIAQHMMFSFSIGPNLFMEIAKFRAARMLWATIVKEFGGNETSQKIKVHARTSKWNKTIYDPHVNILRGAIEAFAGAVGGVDSMHVAPFDEVNKTPSDFSRRVARNTQIILQEESHLGKVTDPAGGSWYVEALTDEVAKKTWELFQETEAKGGLLAALKERFPQDVVAKTAKKRDENIKRRKDIFVGTNQYANPLEKALQPVEGGNPATIKTAHAENEKQTIQPIDKNSESIVDEAISAASHLTMGEIRKALNLTVGEESVEKIPQKRGAEPFERLRLAMERYAGKTSMRPKVFLANVGAIGGYKARADFAAGFFEVGGFEVLTNNGFDGVEETAKAALESNAGTVVIASKDDQYPEAVPALVKKLKEANPELTIYLAGRPSEEELNHYKQLGIEDAVHVKSNVYDVLVNLQKKKGVLDE
ncbi:methylmalonyl-CoA mutase [Pueribacillus theae]|uniref:Methylmalonyl-CoA mutase n=1 Tax=Pueribacillus theae TaxID=2171751 RepID=A0A2U1K779_9BACI|nr:methylmalonyl-CoA mutase family protein [Pueribacillus theae]PWA13105.1 methylmalonyl-CoA mutase [Pueribacillus theae]